MLLTHYFRALQRQNADFSCVLEPPQNHTIDNCGDHHFCCRDPNAQNCCSLGTYLIMGPFSNPSKTTTVVSLTSIVVITVTPTRIDSISTRSSNIQRISSRSTIANLDSSSTKSSTDRTQSATSPTNSDATTLENRTQLGTRSVASPESTPTLGVTNSPSSSWPAYESSSPLPSASPSKDSHQRTSVGLGVGLCLGIGLAFAGIVVWFFRKKRSNPSRRKKLHISRPISVKAIPIPMFEVANTDWELPVDPHMPTELRTHRNTSQSWI